MAWSQKSVAMDAVMDKAGMVIDRPRIPHSEASIGRRRTVSEGGDSLIFYESVQAGYWMAVRWRVV